MKAAPAMPKKHNRPPQSVKPILRIFCEGKKTEPHYFNGYIGRKFPANSRLKVIRIEPTKKNTPKELVEEAVKAKKAALDGDVFWVVYDRESEQKYPDGLHEKAHSNAQKNGVFIALSNVCFEVWLLLHFQESTAAYTHCDDLITNSELRNACKQRGLPDYDKGHQGLFDILNAADIKNARARALRINRQTKNSAEAAGQNLINGILIPALASCLMQ